eukprot:Skav217323  [mRNA]  locus=scaffold3163:502950:518652:- [translate_table: standard]
MPGQLSSLCREREAAMRNLGVFHPQFLHRNNQVRIVFAWGQCHEPTEVHVFQNGTQVGQGLHGLSPSSQLQLLFQQLNHLPNAGLGHLHCFGLQEREQHRQHLSIAETSQKLALPLFKGCAALRMPQMAVSAITSVGAAGAMCADVDAGAAAHVRMTKGAHTDLASS